MRTVSNLGSAGSKEVLQPLSQFGTAGHIVLTAGFKPTITAYECFKTLGALEYAANGIKSSTENVIEI
jgi:hypothetical protein